MGKDVGMLGQDEGSIGLEGLLLPDCPVSHRPQHGVLEENGERGQRGQKQPYASRSRGACLAVVSRARCPLNRTM